MKVLSIARLYFIYSFVWFGASTLADYLFFEEVVNNHVIEENLWVTPLMALFFTIMKLSQREGEKDTISEQVSNIK